MLLLMNVGCGRIGYEQLLGVGENGLGGGDAGPSLVTEHLNGTPTSGSTAPQASATAGAPVTNNPSGETLDAGASSQPVYVQDSSAPTPTESTLDAAAPLAPVVDGGQTGGPNDAGLVGCASGEQFSAPEVLTGIDLDTLFSPSIAADGVTLYFAAQSPADLFTAVRADRTSTAFSAVTALNELNTVNSDVTPSISADGLTLAFAYSPDGTGTRDIQIATRAQISDPFAVSEDLSNINSLFQENTPWIAAGGLELWYASDNFYGVGGVDVWVATRATTSEPFGFGANATSLNTIGDESAPSLTEDGLELFFATNRDGSRDIWRAVRSATGQAFSAPMPVAELNTSNLETDPAISPDGSELFFVSDRGAGQEFWRALRCPGG